LLYTKLHIHLYYMYKKIYKNLIIVSGVGQRVGKTTFICQLLAHFKEADVIALKISPFWHNINTSEDVIIKNDRFLILKESNTQARKDSSRMLLSGAQKTYYIQAVDADVYEAFHYLNDNYIKDKAVICESAALLNYIKPAVHFYISGKQTENIKTENIKRQRKITVNYLNETCFDFDMRLLSLSNKQWRILNSK